LYRYGDRFFDCAGVRMLLEKARDPEDANHASPLYFTCPAISLIAAFLALQAPGPPRSRGSQPGREVERPAINRDEGWTLNFAKMQAQKLLDLSGEDNVAGLRDRAIGSPDLVWTPPPMRSAPPISSTGCSCLPHKGHLFRPPCVRRRRGY
jgi:hypothetical protein